MNKEHIKNKLKNLKQNSGLSEEQLDVLATQKEIRNNILKI